MLSAEGLDVEHAVVADAIELLGQQLLGRGPHGVVSGDHGFLRMSRVRQANGITCPRGTRAGRGVTMERSPERSSDSGSTSTLDLLDRWHQGSDDALERLVTRHLPMVHRIVRARIGGALRGKVESVDVVQEAMMNLLQYLPRFRIADDASFRGLLARIVENVIRDQRRWFDALRRRRSVEQALPEDSVLDLDTGSLESPSAVLARHENEAWLRVGMELLAPDDRDVIALRDWDEVGFREIGERFGASEDAARKRYHRATAKLAGILRRVKRGDLGEFADEA